MSPPREASPEFIRAVLTSINRTFGGPAPIQFGKEDLLEMLPSTVLGAVEELIELLPNSSGESLLHTKWGYDDEGTHPGLPTYDDLDLQDRHEVVELVAGPYNERFTIVRRDTLIEIDQAHSCGSGNVLFWLTAI